MSKIFKQDHQIPTKTIKVKAIDHFIKQKPKDNQSANTAEQLKIKKTSLQKQIAQLTEEITHLEGKKNELIQKTKEEINSLKEAWQSEREAYVLEAQQEGFQQGFKKGEQESLTKYNHLIEEAQKIIHLAQEDYQTTIQESEPAIIKLAIKTAEKIIHQQLEVDGEMIKRIASDVIKDLTEQQEIKLILPVEDYEQIIQQKGDLENLLQKSSKLIILPDVDLEKGMCKIEYPAGKTDASIQTQLQFIEDELLKIVMEKTK